MSHKKSSTGELAKSVNRENYQNAIELGLVCSHLCNYIHVQLKSRKCVCSISVLGLSYHLTPQWTATV